ncbi:MAG: ABC transporter ATP-binding protein [Planctomycetes bacterium]|nr:ABC transporter ATP-binding protein [Planctomycetota bacterium]
MADVRIDRVSRMFEPPVPAVAEVSLRVGDGEIVTVLGPSGSGKSTLLRLVAGLEKADAGDILIADRRVNDLEPGQRDVAMVFQSYALYPHMTVFENIASPLRVRGMAPEEIETRVRRTAERLGLAALLDRRPRALSGGEQQRTALARALVREPKAFLLDEPLSNLDAALRERTRRDIKTLFRQIGATALYVTHDQVEAMTLSDRIAVMKAGRIEQIGTPEEVYDRPATTFVAGFVGSPRMNLLPADVLTPGGGGTVGVRPEDVTICADGPLELEVALRESLGSRTLLTLRRGPLEITVLVTSRDAPSGTARVRIDPTRAHYFDADGKRRSA